MQEDEALRAVLISQHLALPPQQVSRSWQMRKWAFREEALKETGAKTACFRQKIN